MECEEYLRRSRLFRRLRSGPHGQLVERYAARLVGDGLVRHGTWRCFNVVGGLLSWIASRRCALADLDERIGRTGTSGIGLGSSPSSLATDPR